MNLVVILVPSQQCSLPPLLWLDECLWINCTAPLIQGSLLLPCLLLHKYFGPVLLHTSYTLFPLTTAWWWLPHPSSRSHVPLVGSNWFISHPPLQKRDWVICPTALLAHCSLRIFQKYINKLKESAMIPNQESEPLQSSLTKGAHLLLLWPEVTQ